MRRPAASAIVLVWLMLMTSLLHAAPAAETFHFAVIAQRTGGDGALQDALAHAHQTQAAFVVLNGVRPRQEGCADAVFQRRSTLIAQSPLPVLVSLGAYDWADCRNEKRRSIAQDRLGFLRESLFVKHLRLYTKQLRPKQQSTAAMHRQYAENMRWEWRDVLFATVNLPSNNNNYLVAAGRNNEFEDRAMATRHWLRRVFNHARYHKIKSIVLFTDANPMVFSSSGKKRGVRPDGFAEVRNQLTELAGKYQGRVLLIHAQQTSKGIAWRRNLGVLGVARGVAEVTVKPRANLRFAVKRPAVKPSGWQPATPLQEHDATRSN